MAIVIGVKVSKIAADAKTMRASACGSILVKFVTKNGAVSKGKFYTTKQRRQRNNG